MTYKKELFALPCSSAEVIRGPALCIDRGDLLLSMDFENEGQKRSVCLRFVKQRAFRKRSEIYCTGWHVDDVHEAVCELPESDWVAELRNDAVPEWRDRWAMRHFMVFVDSFGCLEVVAESVALEDEDSKKTADT
ncbi:hypothetical protein [Rhizobacter sp. SG703]|uniref:hypothetical protein n=1 Tax=Rhizobacter sp. SG703 TaxID=2587140 RepID=UPI00144518F7|nr:hypothetical protein [Rhizobacter sp. SG703]NKI96514.1 hypothetical protein [Rhizobacter sp. SG703]